MPFYVRDLNICFLGSVEGSGTLEDPSGRSLCPKLALREREVAEW
jgi:hypothetical protein